LKAPLDPPKRAEFHLAKRLLKEAEELLARGSMSSLRKDLGRRPDSQCRQERKRAENPRLPVSETAGEDGELRRPGATPTSPPKTSTGWTPPGDVKYAVEDVKQFAERFKN